MDARCSKKAELNWFRLLMVRVSRIYDAFLRLEVLLRVDDPLLGDEEPEQGGIVSGVKSCHE